jgi:hypothetical protein
LSWQTGCLPYPPCSVGFHTPPDEGALWKSKSLTSSFQRRSFKRKGSSKKSPSKESPFKEKKRSQNSPETERILKAFGGLERKGRSLLIQVRPVTLLPHRKDLSLILTSSIFIPIDLWPNVPE